MAIVTTGARISSTLLQIINREIIESKLIRIKDEETYKNVQEKLNELIDYDELSEDIKIKTGRITKKIEATKLELEATKKKDNKKRVAELKNDLYEAEEALKTFLETNKDTLTEEEVIILEVLSVKNAIDKSKQTEDNKTTKRKNLNTILVAQIRKMHLDNELCPYCHNRNWVDGKNRCQFKGDKKEYAKEEKKIGYKKEDKDGEEVLDAIKEKYKGKTLKIYVISTKTGDIEKVDYDIGENIEVQDHHIISLGVYNTFVGLAAAAKEAGFDVNKNQNEMNNIKRFPSLKVVDITIKQELGYITWNKPRKNQEKHKKLEVYYLTEISKQLIAKKIQEITEETLHLGPHTTKAIEQSEVKNELDILNINLPKEETEEDKERRISYEEMVTIELGVIQEEMYENILSGNYKCSDIDNANKEMLDKIVAVIKKLSKHFYSISKCGSY